MTTTVSTVGQHGSAVLPAVDVAAYNAELKDGDGFLGDRASNRAFRKILEDLRAKMREVGDDPLGDTPSTEISKKTLDKALLEGTPEAAGVVHSAIEQFAQELALVTSRLLKMKEWKGVERIAIGGGLRGSRLGELAIGRTAVLVKEQGIAIELVPIRHHPDHAGIVGTIHLAPPWIFTGFEGIIGVDIGGSNLRAGIVKVGKGKLDLSTAEVIETELWRHVIDKPKRGEAIERLGEMLNSLVKKAKKRGIGLAPFIGVGCPGVIESDGSIAKGAQNLPGNWESSRFNLPESIREVLPRLSHHDTHVLLHNDAVVQGLSQQPWMGDVERWGILTIGTGLGNAVFVNHEQLAPSSEVESAALSV